MARCSYCGQLIVFGAVRVGEESFCRNCLETKRVREEESKRAAEETVYLHQAKMVYEASLLQLREKPHDPALRYEALRCGRLYAAWTRYKQEAAGITLFDEVTLGNDIPLSHRSHGEPPGVARRPAQGSGPRACGSVTVILSEAGRSPLGRRRRGGYLQEIEGS
jgi:hypothetical protein